MLEEIMTDIGFKEIRSCQPVKDTNYPDLFSECLSKERESDFEMPHTLVIEAQKPKNA